MDPNRVQVAPFGPKLGQNDAPELRIIFQALLGPKTQLNKTKNTAILNIDIEQSDDLKTWTLYRKILESIPLPEGKKFYRFALDK